MDPEGCFVAVHGTGDKTNAWLDSKWLQVTYDQGACTGSTFFHGCKVFHGFLLAWESIRYQVFQALTDFGCNSAPLHLIGHSLGAAIQHLVLLEALHLGFDVRHAYMLETPRPGNNGFAEALSKAAAGRDVWRATHYKDLIPHVPPQHIPLLPYVQVFREIYYYNETGKAYRECGVEDTTCSDQWYPTQLTAKGSEHCWFEDVNPCWCDNYTHSPPGTRPPNATYLFV